MSEQEVMLVHGEHAADRLLRSQKLEPGSPYLCGAEPPSPSQVAAVLHALGDHTLLMHLVGDEVKALGDDRGHFGYRWQHATGLGRFFQRMGSWLEYRERLGNPRQSAVEAPSGDEQAEKAPEAVRGVGSAALAEHREDWASYIEHWDQAVGPEAPTVERIVRALRGPVPFGCASATGDESASGAREGGKA